MDNIKKSILVYLDNYPMLISLPAEQRGWVITALMVYGDRLAREEETALEEVIGQFPQLSSEAKLVCGFMGANILRDTRRWQCRQRSRSGTAAPKRSPAPGPASEPSPAAGRKMREDMERVRRLMKQAEEELSSQNDT